MFCCFLVAHVLFFMSGSHPCRCSPLSRGVSNSRSLFLLLLCVFQTSVRITGVLSPHAKQTPVVPRPWWRPTLALGRSARGSTQTRRSRTANRVMVVVAFEHTFAEAGAWPQQHQRWVEKIPIKYFCIYVKQKGRPFCSQLPATRLNDGQLFSRHAG